MNRRDPDSNLDPLGPDRFVEGVFVILSIIFLILALPALIITYFCFCIILMVEKWQARKSS